MSLSTEIPVIDFARCGLNVKQSELNDKEILDAGEELFDAFRNCGFAYLKNTGVSLEEVDILNDVTGKFFKAPLAEKMRYERRPDGYGYISIMGHKNLDPNKIKDYKESFGIPSNSMADPETPWPTDLSASFETTVKAFMETCRLLTLRVLKVLGVGMNLEDTDQFVKNHSLMHKHGNHTTFRTLYYPPMPEEMEKNFVRLGTHSDFGSITLLYQDDVGGLQVSTANDDFIDAVPIKGTVLINIGDMLQSWSRSKLKSTKHRVINKDVERQKLTRRSIAYFVLPDDDVLVDEELVFKGCPVTGKPGMAETPGMTFLDYLKMKFSQVYGES